MKAHMKRTVKLLGTDLVLIEGQEVEVYPASHLPVQLDKGVQVFARPIDCLWQDGIVRGADDSILLDGDDYRY